MLYKDGKIVHPLRRTHISLGKNQVHDVGEPLGRLWFVIDLALPGKLFKPVDSEYIRLADGKVMKMKSRRK